MAPEGDDAGCTELAAGEDDEDRASRAAMRAQHAFECVRAKDVQLLRRLADS